jgi:SAM-dependent methyltransferase
VDISVNPDCSKDPRVVTCNGYLPAVLSDIDDHSVDLVIMNSVLEHLDDPVSTLIELRRVLSVTGVLFINVPTWIGKRALEFSAFRLGLSPRDEMEDHRRYYNNKQLWQEVRLAGFAPSAIKIKRHKFGLNVCCVVNNKISAT